MIFPDPDLIIKLLRRHAHDVRNHCSGLDLDAALLAEISDNPEILALASRLKNQVSRIETGLKAILLKVEDARPVTVTTGDLLQMWQHRVSGLTGVADVVEWPGTVDAVPILLDSRLVIQVLTELTLKACSRNRGVPVKVVVNVSPHSVAFSLCEPISAILPEDYMEETARVLTPRGAQLQWALDSDSPERRTTLSVPR